MLYLLENIRGCANACPLLATGRENEDGTKSLPALPYLKSDY